MGVSDKLLKQLESPLDKLTEYKDKESKLQAKICNSMEKSDLTIYPKK